MILFVVEYDKEASGRPSYAICFCTFLAAFQVFSMSWALCQPGEETSSPLAPWAALLFTVGEVGEVGEVEADPEQLV